MVQKKTIRRTDQEWLELIQECRASGLSDAAWCEAHGLHRSTLYHHIRKLRNKACDIPAASHRSKTGFKQEVVPVTFVEEEKSFPPEQNQAPDSGKIAASIQTGSIRVEIYNGAYSATIRDILSALGDVSC